MDRKIVKVVLQVFSENELKIMKERKSKPHSVAAEEMLEIFDNDFRFIFI